MSVGATLAEARERAGLTVAQLSDRTRIREAVIEGIERDDFSVCGGDFYARGHIRAMASALQLDPEELVRQYDELHEGMRPPIRASSVFKADGIIGNRGRRAPNWTMTIVVALALVVVFVVMRLLGGSGEKSGESAVRLPISAQKAGPEHARAHDAKAREVVLKVFAKKPAFINVKDAQGRRLFQGVLPEGRTSTWTAKERMRVTFGDAGAVRVEVNGKDVGSLGGDGQTVRRTFEAGNPGAR